MEEHNGKYKVLFLCTGNSARSIMAEALLNQLGSGRFEAYSAGSNPRAEVNPLVMDFLHAQGIDATGVHSKSWDNFASPDAPHMDLVVTLCDRAANETCPVWPGLPAKAHWSAPDIAPHMDTPAHAQRVIRDAFHQLRSHVELLINLPMEALDRQSLEHEARSIPAAG